MTLRLWHAREGIVLAAIAVAVVAVGFSGSDYWVYSLSLVAVYAIVAIGFNIALGQAGQVWFAQAAFMAVGAYTTGLLTVKAQVNPWLALLCSLVIGAALSWLVSLPFLRLQGHYLGMASLALALGVESFAENANGFTGGAIGIPGVPPLAIGSFAIDTHERFFILAWAACGITLLVYYLTVKSHIGRSWRAIATRPDVSASLGIQVPRARLLALVMGGTMAALSGSLLADYLNYVAPNYFDIVMIGNIFFMVIVGGLGSTAGPLIGAAFIVLLPQQMSSFGQWQGVLLLLVLLACLVLWPTGLLGDPSEAGTIRSLLPVRLQAGLSRVSQG